MNSQLRPIEEEIGLVDIIRIFIRRKKLFLMSFIIFLCLGLTYVFFIYQPKYQYSAYIQLGGYNKGPQFILLPKFKREMYILNTVIFPQILNQVFPRFPHLSISSKVGLVGNVKNSTISSRIVQIRLIGNQQHVKKYQQFFAAILQILNQDELADLNDLKLRLQNKIKDTQKKILFSKRKGSKWFNIIQQFQKTTFSAGKNNYVLNFNLSSMIQQYNALTRQQANLDKMLQETQRSLGSLKPSHFIPQVAFVAKDSGIGKKGVMLLTLMAAIFGAIFLTVMAELLSGFWIKDSLHPSSDH